MSYLDGLKTLWMGSFVRDFRIEISSTWPLMLGYNVQLDIRHVCG